jgi:hypothetical protein
MAEDFSALLKKRVECIKFLTSSRQGAHEYLEAGGLALIVINEAVGGSHPCRQCSRMRSSQKIGRELQPRVAHW